MRPLGRGSSRHRVSAGAPRRPAAGCSRRSWAQAGDTLVQQIHEQGPALRWGVSTAVCGTGPCRLPAVAGPPGPRRRGRSPHLTPHIWALSGRRGFHGFQPLAPPYRNQLVLCGAGLPCAPAERTRSSGPLAPRGCPDATPHPESTCPSSSAPTSQLFLKPLAGRASLLSLVC